MANDAQTWLQMVRTLAAENASVRINLSAEPIEEGGRTARVRVLAVGPDGVSVIEEPGVRDLGNRLRPGDELDILAVQKQARLVGRCRVIRYVSYQLNETISVDAVEVSPPSKVFSGQLRDFYRAPIGAGIEIDPAQLRLDPADASALQRAELAQLDPGKTHKARIVNISGGGMGLAIVVDKVMAKLFEVGTRVAVYAELPTLDKPLDLDALVVHTETLQNGDLYLGVSFQIDDAQVQKQVEDQLQRLSVWLQRQMLRREQQK